MAQVFIFPKALAELRAYIRSAKASKNSTKLLEISGMGTVQVFDNSLYVKEIFLLPQGNGGAHTDFDQEKVAEFLAKKVNDGVDIGEMKLWWHSHAEMGTFWSGTDTATMDLFSYTDWMLFLVANAKDEMRWRLQTYRPVTLYLDELPWKMLTPQVDEAKISAEIEANVKWAPASQPWETHKWGPRQKPQYTQEELKTYQGDPNPDHAPMLQGTFYPESVFDGEWFLTEKGYFRIWSKASNKEQWCKLTPSESCEFAEYLAKTHRPPLDREDYEAEQTELAKTGSLLATLDRRNNTLDVENWQPGEEKEQALFELLQSNDPKLVAFRYSQTESGGWEPEYGCKWDKRRKDTDWMDSMTYFQSRKGRKLEVPDGLAEAVVAAQEERSSANSALTEEEEKELDDIIAGQGATRSEGP